MAGNDKQGMGGVELVSIAVVAVFAIVLLFVVFSALAGAVWWAIKTAALIVILFLIVRWAFRRSTR
jgi:apolipoprotein N-acyltransferase